VGKENVVVATVAVISLHVVGEHRSALREELERIDERHQNGVEIIRRTAHQPERRFGPHLHGRAPPRQIIA